MSELLVNTIKKADGTGSLSVPAESGTVVTTASPSLGRRNLILNGSMAISQRGTSFSLSSSDAYTLDRWAYNKMGSYAGAVTVSQDTNAPNGFSNSLKCLVTTAASLAAGDGVTFRTKIEAQNLQQLAYGTSGANQSTMSFWVKSNTTGTYTVWFNQEDATRQFTGTYTVNSADTWEYKTITIPADTSGGIDNNNGIGFEINWALGVGTTYTSGTTPTAWEATTTANRYAGQTADVTATLNNYWQITGVQLEVGSVATPFEHRSYGEELALCQRYYYHMAEDNGRTYFGTARGESSTIIIAQSHFPVKMRDKPTLSFSGTSGWFFNASSNVTSVSNAFTDGSSTDGFSIAFNVSGATTNAAYTAMFENAGGAYLGFDAEL